MFWTTVPHIFWLVRCWQTWFKLSRLKLYRKWPEGKRKLLQVSGRFELLRVRVAEGKIAENVWRKSRGNRYWFELTRIRVIGSPLYIYMVLSWFEKGVNRTQDIVCWTNRLFLSRINDIIVQVNEVNVENVMHAAAVQALKDSGNSARLVSPTSLYI